MDQNKFRFFVAQYTFILFFIIFEASYNSLFYFGSYTPFYELMVIFCLNIFFSTIFPIWMCFLLGIFRDIILLAPLGISSLSFILLRALIHSQQSYLYNKPFYKIFLIYLIDSFLIVLFQLILLMIKYNYNLESIGKLLITRWAVSGLLYPCMHFIFYLITFNLINKNTDALQQR